MFIESILNGFKTVIETLFSWINIPSAGAEFQNGINYFTDMLDVGQSLIDLFIPWNLVRFGLPLLMAVVHFERLYKFVMWVLRKIPMLGID